MSGTQNSARPPMPIWAMVVVLFGFPAFFYLWSLALLYREAFTIGDIDFFVTYWAATGLIYAAKIALVFWLIKKVGWSLADIGLGGFDDRRIKRVVITYVVAALAVFLATEYAVTQVSFDEQKLAALPGLYAETTQKRLLLLFMAFFAGISEEVTYRGFAISGLVSRGLNRWLAIVMAAIPFVFQHGLKSLDQFWWFFINGLIIGAIYVLSRKLWPGIIIHWLLIWSALLGVFSAVTA
jgi:uncharacterized protein